MKNILLFRSIRKTDGLLGKLNEIGSGKLRYFESNFDDISIFIPNNLKTKCEIRVGDKPIDKFDLVYFKTWILYREVAKTIARYLKYNKMRFVDSNVAYSTTGGKLFQMMMCYINGIQIPKTMFYSSKIIIKKIDCIVNTLKLPLIMKEVFSSKGNNNYLIYKKEEIVKILNFVKGRDFIFQEYIGNDFDYRIITFGWKEALVFKRVRQNILDYRNNIALGAKRIKVQFNKFPYSKLALKTAKVFGREISGIDLIISEKGEPFVIEINQFPSVLKEEKNWLKIKYLNKYFKGLM